MNLNVIIAQLKQRAPLFAGGTVAGAARFQVLPEAANLKMPAAYVLPLDEQPEDQSSQNGYQQTVREGFAVVVALSNREDERGQGAASDLDAVRRALFKALLGFQPAEEYDVITFEGGQLLHLDRARMYYQFEFSVDFAISTEDTWIPQRNDELPDFEGLDIRLDALDIFDPNTPEADHPGDPNAYPGGKGPDGRAEAGATIDLPTS
jgi:hypothetical protein